LVLQHTLPKGFRRARDYGFLHGNAKNLLILIQIVLKARLPVIVKTEDQNLSVNAAARQ
jgi:hypothetical protein